MKSSKLAGWLIPVLIGLFTFLLLIFTNADIGITWDEPAYVSASESYMGWFDKLFHSPSTALSDSVITEAWQVNSEHPPLDKIWSGFVWSIARHFTDDLTAHRMGNMILMAVMVAILYVWVKKSYGMIAGIVAAAALLTMPRVFFHGHLSSLDIPAAFSVFITTYLFWQLKDRKGWGWSVLLGVVWGLALATKVNSVFIPFTLGLWWLIFNRKWNLFFRVVLMGLIALPVFLSVWPWLYHDTLPRLFTYVGFLTSDHWQIGQFFLGQFYMPPPWYFGFVMLWAVLPISLICLFLIGFIRHFKGKQDGGLGWLFMISALTPVLAIATSRSVVYDNDRMYMAAFPFIAALAGMGFSGLLQLVQKWLVKIQKPTLQWIGTVVLTLICFLPQTITMVRLYPHYLSYYGEGVGGVAGANKLGLETTYWCETYSLALPILNEQAQPRDRVWVDPWSHDVLILYQTRGLLRDDLRILVPYDSMSVLGPNVPQPVTAPFGVAEWFLVQQRQTSISRGDDQIPADTFLAQKQKVYEYAFDGVPVFAIYKK